jgi:type VI secretion system secreted protein VgrG
MSLITDALSVITQQGRSLRLNTSIGDDVLLVDHCAGEESLSGLFSFDLNLLLDLQMHRTSEVDAKDLLGSKVTLTLALKTGERCFNGIVKRFVQSHRDDRFQYYHMEIVPWAWLLTLKSDCRIFQNLSIPEIVTQIFDGLKSDYSDIVSYRNALTKQYTTRDYCVQYRETAFDFVSRLMEHEGIFYFFEHTDDGHCLVLADSNTSFEQVPDNGGQFCFAPEGGHVDRLDTIMTVNREHELRPGKWSLRDYHFEMPSKSLQKSEVTTSTVANNPALERYDYPGTYAPIFNQPGARLGDVDPTGGNTVRVRMEEEEAKYQVLTGSSQARAFGPGYQFELTDHRDMAGKYVLVAVSYNMSQAPSYISAAGAGNPYQNDFVCIPLAVPYRPQRRTQKPLVQGPQTAMVTVKDGEDSWIDKYGRVRVQFHWDRLGKSNEESTCWVRVSQSWAGSGWGSHYWPRGGQEVVVEFLEGDPDQPIVTGSVYNSSQMPPYQLPENYTRSGVKSRSSKNGTAANYNEIRFEDKKGVEQVYIQAEKDMDVNTKDQSREYVGKDRHLIVCADQLEQVQANKHQQVAGNKLEKIESGSGLHVMGNRVTEIDLDDNLTVRGTSSTKVIVDLEVQVGNEHAEAVGRDYILSAGRDVYFKPERHFIIEAGLGFCIRTPGGFIKVDSEGITLQGVKLKLNSGGDPLTAPFLPTMMDPPLPVDPTNPDIADDGTHGGKSNSDKPPADAGSPTPAPKS